MLRLTDYNLLELADTAGLANSAIPYILLSALGFVLLVLGTSFENCSTTTRVILIVAAVASCVTGVLGAIHENKIAEDTVATANTEVREWLGDGYGIKVNDDEASTLRDGASLVVEYEKELISITLRDVAGGGVTVFSDESSQRLEPIR